MKRNTRFRLVLLSLVVMLSIIAGRLSAMEVVASIKDLKGEIEVKRNQRKLAARTGLILYDQDIVTTGRNAKVTIVFRDGSVIRLFANSRFIIEESVEEKKGARRFLHQFMLKLGSFWGRFSRKYQQTSIRTPTATAGIKGTILSMSERNGTLDVALTSGSVTLQNEREKIDLQPGEMAIDITRNETIRDKIQDLPYRLVFKPDVAQIEIPDSGDAVVVYFTLQMVQKDNGQNAARPGPVYISHEFDNIRFDHEPRLNARGYARIKATIRPFLEKDSLRETIEFTAVMDGETFMNVDAGQTSLVIIQSGQKAKTLKIDVNSDQIE